MNAPAERIASTPKAIIALGILLACSGALNVLLGVRIIAQENSRNPVPRIKAGAHLDTIIGSDPDGLPSTVRFSDTANPTVLLILRPGCAWCDKNMPNWHALIDAKGQTFRFVAVSLSPIDLKPYLKTNA